MKTIKNVMEINDSVFDSSVEKGVVLVDFWAAWCAPCRMQSPILDEVAEEINGQAVIAKLNVDENRMSAEKYQIMSIPTLLLFKDGKPQKQFVGVQSKDVLVEQIRNLL